MKKYAHFVLVLLVFVLIAIPGAATAQEAQDYPAPTGPYQVGKTSRHWVDNSREETFSEDPDDVRELMVRIWYPAEVEPDAVPVPYTENMSAPEGSDQTNPWLNPIVLRFIQWTSYSYPDAPLSDSQPTYPVLIFSHGYRGVPEQYTTQMEDLASHGYIVVGIVHPYFSGVVVYPDGRVVTGIEMGVSDSLDRHAETSMICAQDIVFAVDQLEILNADDPEGTFTGRLDLERIGAFGHSLGGTAAALAGTLDPRLQAIVVEDGGMSTDYDWTMLEQPFMFLYGPLGTFPSAGPRHTVSVSDFAHLSFPDFPVWPVPMPGVGSVEGTRTVEIIRAYVRAFFDQYLKGEDSALLDGPSDDYPEVQIWSRNAD
jgi:pimeloyl-ACP methyl ester carboxylesterase